MSFSTEMKDLATELIAEFGTSASVECVDGTVLEGVGVVVNSRTNDGPQGFRNIKVCYFQGTDEGIPTAGGFVSLASKTWSITRVNDINPDGTLTIVFEMEVEQ